MEKVQKELLKSYYRARGLALNGRYGGTYHDYEYSKYALDKGIMDLEPLSISKKYDLFQNNKRVREYVAPYIDEYNKGAKGFLRLLLKYNETGDGTALHAFFTKSKFLQENGNVNDIEIDDTINLGVDKEKLLSHMNLEYDYDSLQHYIDGETSWDSDEQNYMHYNIGGVNQAKVKKIAKILGKNQAEIDGIFQDEGDMAEFLNDNDMGQVVDTFLQEFHNAKSRAEDAAATAQSKNFPFDFSFNHGYGRNWDSFLDIDNTIRYFYENDPSAITSFDQFLSYVEDNSNINSESVYEEADQYLDHDELEYDVGRELDNILDDFEDTHSKYYSRVQGQRDVQDILKKRGFNLIPKADDDAPFAVREQPDKTINIMDWGYSEGDEILQLELEIIYKENLDKGEKVRTGWINADRLGNFVDQYEVPELREEKN